MSSFPDPGSLDRDSLTSQLKQLTARESAVSNERKLLHVQIDALRHELVKRLRSDGQTVIVSGADGVDEAAGERQISTAPGPPRDVDATPPAHPGTQRARLEQTDDGVIPVSTGWFVLNAVDARWFERPGRGHNLPLTGRDDAEAGTLFPMLGMALAVMRAEEPSTTYHWETEQEDFLVLAGEATLIIEGEELPLTQWDFVHCPPGTRHTFVGRGAAPCVVLCASSRQFQEHGPWGLYCADSVAARHNASAPENTADPATAYARFPPSRSIPYPGGLLPGTGT